MNRKKSILFLQTCIHPGNIVVIKEVKTLRTIKQPGVKVSTMRTSNQNEVLLNIQQLIDKSRCGIDGFFTDSKSAATDILKYLESENILIKDEVHVNMNYSESSRAA